VVNINEIITARNMHLVVRWQQSILCKCCRNHNTTDHTEGEQLEDRRNVGESSCNFGDGTDQKVQSLMFMMMIMTAVDKVVQLNSRTTRRSCT